MDNSTFLGLVNVLLTSGVLLALVGAAVKYGRLVEKVEHHDVEIINLRKSHHDVRELLMHVPREKE
jgi:hypothetical protein